MCEGASLLDAVSPADNAEERKEKKEMLLLLLQPIDRLSKIYLFFVDITKESVSFVHSFQD